ncbi:MAG: hypothetical protein R3D33_17660 [Hyphomicrobiaceae bacterium]
MHDIKWIRENPEAFDERLKVRGLSPMAGPLIALDEARRAHLTRLQEAQSRRNAASKEIGKAKAAKDNALADRLMKEVADLKGLIQEGEAEERRLDEELAGALAVIPNLPLADVPVGPDETATRRSAGSASRGAWISRRSSISSSARRWGSWISRRRRRSRAPASSC